MAKRRTPGPEVVALLARIAKLEELHARVARLEERPVAPRCVCRCAQDPFCDLDDADVAEAFADALGRGR